MQRPGPGRRIDRGRRSVSGTYFDLACLIAKTSQEHVAGLAGVSSSTISRGFSSKSQVERDKLLKWGDILLNLCPEEDKVLLLEMEARMLHTLGVSTRDDEQEGNEQLDYYQQRVKEVLQRRQKTP